jgi:hypothetical protein
MRGSFELLSIKGHFTGLAFVSHEQTVTLPKLKLLDLQVFCNDDGCWPIVFFRALRVPMISDCSVFYSVEDSKLDRSLSWATDFSSHLLQDMASNKLFFDELIIDPLLIQATGQGELRLFLEFQSCSILPTQSPERGYPIIEICFEHPDDLDKNKKRLLPRVKTMRFEDPEWEV